MTENPEEQIPEWADTQFSRDLPELRARGEGQELEYMEEFPTNTRELAKEIAAFATSNSGIILLGVSDQGDLIGLQSCKKLKGRDQILNRLQGISNGSVKPAITPIAKFAIEDNSVILVITVPKGNQPVYYHSNTPYLRHLTESRPAHPHEVVEKVSEYLQVSSTPKESDETSYLYQELSHFLVDILLFGDQVEERLVNPWLDMWRSKYTYAAQQLREISAEQRAIDEEIDNELRELANDLEEVGNFRLYLGAGEEILELNRMAVESAKQLFDQYINRVPEENRNYQQFRDQVSKFSRKLTSLSSRAKELIDNARIDEFKSEASDIGYSILRLTYFYQLTLKEKLRDNLLELGKALHLTETKRIYLDGGKSLNELINQVHKLEENLSSILDKFE